MGSVVVEDLVEDLQDVEDLHVEHVDLNLEKDRDEKVGEDVDYVKQFETTF